MDAPNLILPYDEDSRLDRRIPTDWGHVDRYSLTLETLPTVATPVVIGVNWYRPFYEPIKVGTKYWIGLDPKNLGKVMGGHCVCIKAPSMSDPYSWWDYYDQGQEGACVGFGSSRAMSLIERTRFDARWLYQQAQLVDPWPETPPEEGTSVSAAMDILRKVGHIKVTRGKSALTPEPNYGIIENRWARTVDQIVTCLGAPELYKIGGVPILNSWGRSYPHVVYMPFETLQRLLDEYGEATMFTRR